MKKCSKCGEEKEYNYFNKSRSVCKKCRSEYNKKYRLENIIEITSRQKKQRDAKKSPKIIKDKEEILKEQKEHKKIYNEENKEYIAEKAREYKIKNKEKIAEYKRKYQIENRDELLIKRRERIKNRKLIDPIYKLRIYISSIMAKVLKQNNSSKNGESCLKYLSYTIQELKEYLEKQFSLPGNEWMSWNNYGTYKVKKWKDDDICTWTWNIDHIIPQSKLPYTSMEEDNFKICWALENLRPYSAKQNIMDGNRR